MLCEDAVSLFPTSLTQQSQERSPSQEVRSSGITLAEWLASCAEKRGKDGSVSPEGSSFF